MNDIRGQGDPRDEIMEHLPQMRAFAVSLTQNSSSSDDLVQDSIIKAWNNFDKFTPGTNLQAWLFTIVRNTFYSDLRKRKRELAQGNAGIEEFIDYAQDGDAQIAFIDFQRAFSELPAEYREVLTLVGAIGMSYEEAADTCGVAVGTIKSRMNRGRKKLATLIDHARTDQDDDPQLS